MAAEAASLMQRQLEEFQHSITIVLWYKAATEPLRLRHYVTTFPLFQLSHLPVVISTLNLSPSSYLDTYDSASSRWIQHTVETVRMVQTQQILLYRVRRGLLETLQESECIGLNAELEPCKIPVLETSDSDRSSTQSLPMASKRPLEDESPRTTPKLHITSGYYASHSSSLRAKGQPNSASVQTNSLPTPSTPGPSRSAFSPRLKGPIDATEPLVSLPSYLVSPSLPSAIPYHPHPPLKRWPNDFTVSEIAAGLNTIDLLVAHSSGMTQRAAFERVFGSRYVKSTVCRHRAVWRQAEAALKDEFLQRSDDTACWGEFVRRAEGRSGQLNRRTVPSPFNETPSPSHIEPLSGQQQQILALSMDRDEQ